GIENAVKLQDKFKIINNVKVEKLNDTLKAVYIDTGENGIFSRGEFDAISTIGQMEYVTPEEIAEDVVFEIKGGNTGHDIINALDNSVMSPTYRAGFMHTSAIKKMQKLEQEYQTDSVAFEMLGPPRLSKLLYEAQLLKLNYNTMRNVITQNPKDISDKLFTYIKNSQEIRSKIISIGIPILLPDGKSLLRGKEIKIPPYRGEDELPITDDTIDLWAHDGWVDLRESNWKKWIDRIKLIMYMTESIPETDTSSRYVRDRDYWNNFEEIDIGKIVGWIFIYEEQGERMKS
ncbi:MAG: short-chain dehydrogenase, partial [Ignavibacteria bacterium]|nr:short-chain dehydrogenase [Ignavibacteria bacterium]